MSDPEIEARVRAIHEQNLLVRQLRDSGNDEQASRLQETHHAREMSGLAADVYLSAKHEGEAPTGWVRGSADPGAVRAVGIDLSDAQLSDLLHPRQSGFRAEIYIPDKRVLGEDAKPVIVFKGSTGEIIDPSALGGRRESASEDFLNNGQQGVGMRSDYYDRAMALAVRVQQQVGENFEIAGHSLGGGMASAASAVTGARATTFNSAGLHPQTAARYGEDNGLPTFNTRDTVHTYETSGEVLNDVQNGLQRLSDRQRQDFGLLANETTMLLRQPMMQDLVTGKLQAALPEHAQEAATQLIERLATEPGAQALRSVPVAAGRMEILLDPKTRDAQGNLIDRAQVAAPSQVAELAGPLSTVLVAGAQGMRGGRLAGEQIERMGALGGKGLDVAGDVIQQGATMQGKAIGSVVDFGGTSLRVGVQGGATVIAQGRELAGQVEAIKHRVEGYRDRTLSGWGATVAGWVGADETAEQLRQRGTQSQADHALKAEQATQQAAGDAARIRAGGEHIGAQIQAGTQWSSDGLRNGYAQYGATLNQAADWSGQQVAGVTSYAPVVLSSVGGATTALGSALATHTPALTMPQNERNLASTTAFTRNISAAFGEATARHGMADTVIPSLDAEIQKQEAAARTLLEVQQQAPSPAARPVSINDPDHADFRLFQGAQSGVHRIDASYNRVPDLQSDQLAGALAAKAKQDGLQTIEQVMLSDDRARAFAVDTADAASFTKRYAYVDVASGLQQPLSVSTEQAAEVDRQRQAPAITPPLTAGIAAEQQDQQDHAQEQQRAALRMA